MIRTKYFRYLAPIDLDNIDTSGPGDHDPNADRGDKPVKGGEGEDDADDASAQAAALEALRQKDKDKDDKKVDDEKVDDKKADDKKVDDPLRGKGETDAEKADREKLEGRKGVIPVDRHEKVLNNERARREQLERELAAFKGAEKVTKVNDEISKLEGDVEKLDEDLAKAMADGDTAKATALSRQIRGLEREIASKNTSMAVAAAEARATENARYDVALERIEAAFPQLNSDHEDFDEELASDVGDLMTVYRQRGMTPAKALQQAVSKLLKPETSKQTDATTVTPRVDDKKDDKSEKDVRADRKADAVDKAIDAHKRTPPSTEDVGKNSDKLGGGLNSKDVAATTYDQFSKLSEDDLARVRGDIL